jgi:hypothetical protein
MIVLAIDPGPTRSAWCLYGPGTEALDFGTEDNPVILAESLSRYVVDCVVIEKVESFGMAVGAEVFETVFWSGRFAERASMVGLRVDRIGRKAVKLHLCGTHRAKDPNIRQALVDRFGDKGTKAHPGFLYGVSGDVWSALAVAVTWTDKEGSERDGGKPQAG